MGEFNAKEIVNLTLLFREARLALEGLTEGFEVRRGIFNERPGLGPGGFQSLQAFYPLANAGSAHRHCVELRQFMSVVFDVVVVDLHDIQWFLCVFSKFLNQCYVRKHAFRFPDLKFFAEWYDRMLSYPVTGILRACPS